MVVTCCNFPTLNPLDHGRPGLRSREGLLRGTRIHRAGGWRGHPAPARGDPHRGAGEDHPFLPGLHVGALWHGTGGAAERCWGKRFLGKKKCEKWLFFYPEELLVSFNIIYIYAVYIYGCTYFCDAMINLCYVISLLLHVIRPSAINNPFQKPWSKGDGMNGGWDSCCWRPRSESPSW